MSRSGTPPQDHDHSERLAKLGNAVSEPVLIIDADHQILWGNDAARAFYPGASKGLVGRSCHEVIHNSRHPCDASEEICPVDTVCVSGVSEHCEKVLTDAAGNRAPCILSAEPVLGPRGEFIECVLTRKEVEVKDEVWRIVQQQADDLSLLHDLNQLANEGIELKELMERLSANVRATFRANYATLYLLDSEGERLDLLTPGVPSRVRKAVERIIEAPLPQVVIKLERAPLHRTALASPEFTVVPDREGIVALMAENTDSAMIRKLLSPIVRVIGMNSGALIPLRESGRPIGLMAVGRRTPFDANEHRRLGNLATQVAALTIRLRLQDERRRMSRRQSLLLQAVAEGVLGLDSEGEVVFANASAISLLGRNKVEILGKTIKDLCGQRSLEGTSCCDNCRVVASLQDRQPRYEIECTLLTLDDQIRPARLSAVPLHGPELSLVITLRDISEQIHHRQAEKRANERLRRSFSGTVAALRRLAEMRDPYTAGHERRVAQLARAIAQRMDLDEDVVDAVRLAATIHDIGKHAIPVEILTKPGKLSHQEMELIRTHSVVGWEIVTEADFPDPIATVVRQHHERLDGSGYPDGISGDAIALEARIIAVADVVEAMASHRPYRAALGLEDALYEVQCQKGIHYDPLVVSACVQVFRSDGFTFE